MLTDEQKRTSIANAKKKLLKMCPKYSKKAFNNLVTGDETWPRGYKTVFMLNTHLSMKFFLLINVKMPTIVGILTFMSGKTSILGLSEPKKG